MNGAAAGEAWPGREVVVGALGASHAHLHSRFGVLAGMPGVRLAGVADDDTACAQAAAARHGVPWRAVCDLLSDPALDVVLVEGWNTLNPAYALAAIEAGKGVLLEKPGAVDAAALRPVLAATELRPVPAQLGYMIRYSPSVAWAREVLRQELLGRISLARFHVDLPAGFAGLPSFSDPRVGHGTFAEDACHTVDIALHLLGRPREVQARTFRLGIGANPHEDAAVATLVYDDLVATIDFTCWSGEEVVAGWEHSLYGTNGTLHFSLFPARQRLYLKEARPPVPGGWTSREDPPHGRAAWYSYLNAYEWELEDIVAGLRQGRPWRGCDLAQGVAVLEVIDAVYHSAANGGAPVDVRDVPDARS